MQPRGKVQGLASSTSFFPIDQSDLITFSGIQENRKMACSLLTSKSSLTRVFFKEEEKRAGWV